MKSDECLTLCGKGGNAHVLWTDESRGCLEKAVGFKVTVNMGGYQTSATKYPSNIKNSYSLTDSVTE